MAYEKELEVAKELAIQAGAIMLQYFDGDQQIEIKADNTPVTVADKLINDLVIQKLVEAFPNDGIIGEEKSTTEYGMGRKWFCDPIDGTKAYVWGVPTAMFSLALVIDGRPVLGVAYDPFLKKLYEATLGSGSYCTSNRLSVSTLTLKGSVVAVTSTAEKMRTLAYISKLEEAGAKLASFSGALYKGTLVARGKFSAYLEGGVNAHDMAALEVIVTEAGGMVTNFKGETLNYSAPFKGAVISNSVVHQQLIDILGVR
jgi:fructose-1,6-bisphosphatase/inositol monophosphatase family enzyme